MTAVSNSGNRRLGALSGSALWYPISMGAAFAGTMIAASLLPYDHVGLAFTGLLAALLVIDTFAIRRGVLSFWPRLKESGWLFALIAFLLLLASIALIFTVVRPYDQFWLGFLVAGLNLGLYVGSWILRERSNGHIAAG
jgi:hypothetical protein